MTGKTPMWRRYLTFWGRDIDRDLRDELEFHIEARTRELVDAGWPPDAAAAEARRQFGNRDAIVSECHQIEPFSIYGRSEQEQLVRIRPLATNFFSTMGVRILAGRDLQPTDRRGRPGVALVNEAFVRRYFDGESPLGKRLLFALRDFQPLVPDTDSAND